MSKPAIKGFVETSFCDWDGEISSVIFLPGCNFRCPFCQNGALVTAPGELPTMDFDLIAAYLKSKSDWIDGVVITGGEPTIWDGLAELAREIKSMGFGIKLDTNGTNPDMVEALMGEGLVDYVAMDIKSALDERYNRAAGASVDLEAIGRSIDILMSAGDSCEFRTTLVPGIVGEEEIDSIARSIKGARKYVLQRFVPDNSLDMPLRQALPYQDTFIAQLVERASVYVAECFYRGRTGAGLS
ncbi:MAG: anaerobic ribonucleoside-triphosphate reductase activating protein [bacterium]|jgi:pyruvate formate lyase activating enzyme